MIAFCLGFASIIASAADVRITLPLEGHYRAGRFMPVHVSASGIDGGSLTLSAEGAVPVRIDAEGGKVDATVPWLIERDSIRSIRWSDGSVQNPITLPLQPLADNERLVGIVGDGTATARRLFRGNSVIVVRLDQTQNLLSAPSAWEALDGIVLDPAAAAPIDESQLRPLLAAGTAVAIRFDQKPNGNWPWTRDGNAWVVRSDPAGPTGVIEAGAYAPTYGWLRGRPTLFRRHALLAAVGFAILTLAASLWRSRYVTLSVIGVSFAAAGLWMTWERSQSPILEMDGRVLVRHKAMMQIDHWTWYSTLRAAPTTCMDVGLTKPIFASNQQIATSSVTLHWNPTAQSGIFEFHLEPHTTLAFCAVGRVTDRD